MPVVGYMSLREQVDAGGDKTRPYVPADEGSVASLGLYKGVAEVYGVRLRGFPAWLMHRGYHLSWVPTLSHN